MDRELQLSNPLRPVDWRYRLACGRVKDGLQVSIAEHDGPTCEFAKYLRWRERCNQVPYSNSLTQKFPVLHVATQIFEAADRTSRFSLEAHLLAGVDHESIASLFGADARAVGWYAEIYFDVADRLECRETIRHLMGWNEPGVRPWSDFGWKLLAYLGGKDALDEVLRRNQSGGVSALIGASRLETRVVLAHKTAMAARLLNAGNDQCAISLLKIASDGSDLQGNDPGPNSLEANIQAALMSMQFAIGNKRDITGPFARFDSCATELRSEELLQLAVGNALSEAIIEDLKFPDSNPAPDS